MDADRTRAASLAVLGLSTTTGTPPLIVQAAVLHLTGSLITGGPFTYWVAPDTSTGGVPARWPTLRLAPPWAEVAGRLVERLDGRTLVVHEPAQLDVLRRHLPDWHPAGILITRDLAQQLWPRLDGYDLDTLTARVTNQRVDRVGPGAVTEARAVALLLGALLPAASHPPASQAIDPGRPKSPATLRSTDGTDDRRPG